MGIRYWEERAAAGSVVANSVLGCTLVWGGELDGERLDPDYVRALQYLQRAADAGASRAMYHLGVLYEDGLGVPEDLPRAVELLERAADAGEYFAILHVARLYADGRLGYTDSGRARFWYEQLLELAADDPGGDAESDAGAAAEGDADVDADADAEIAEAKLFTATGTLPVTARRPRGCP